MQNGLEQKSAAVQGDEFDSSYMHPTNVNQVGWFFPSKSVFSLDAKRRLATFAGGCLRHWLKIDQPFKSNFVYVELSNC